MSTRRRLGTILAALAVTIAAPAGADAGEAPPRLVLAHYMACCPRSGLEATVADLSAEIAAARAAGIDGFSINFGAYAAEPHYPRIIARLFEAAAAFPDFHLVLSFDQMDVADSIPVAERYADHPSSLTQHGALVVSGFGLTPRWAETFSAGMRERGIPVRLVPNLLPARGGLWARISGATASGLRHTLDATPALAGLFTFGAGRPYDELETELRDAAALLARRSRIHMAGISPGYRGLGGNARVFENDGFEGMRRLWRAAIESGTPWVQLVTWNDWNEATYLQPFASPFATVWRDHPAWQRLPDHGGFLAASRWYIDWFKNGRPPPIGRDRLFYFYRPHLEDAEGVVDFAPETRGRPRFADTLVDRVHVATFLAAPADVTVTVGDRSQTTRVPAGAGAVSVPMAIGDVAVELRRPGAAPLRAVLPVPIGRTALPGNFDTLSGEVTFGESPR
ncbi:endo-1,3-alpha-glucanase family glycosylhydrolase [Rhodoplanes sp. TEM]|uniref:Endo-1,3-alpha-glucanase family glycosylhydrolase n=1 Tax=Rhodoplanes tepidamans TaxID=200616 RepID=A0ABT5JAP2_RHOTP|nr:MULTISPECIES: endo-1,3-alpha-glucanase family glycosylhydrolase [Rhodoplanes]MDC7786715.1 endo-1,3-alpha-glucanase family glycosylhydrolase [Rhodoplanes tepidamans]MDC7983721.1 endo-1,3-alpha-glucanase family glycosylhydrolase [Rhodoplanes sp. TEM]MDQ0358151.1 hypothetical protein [Rhodoplanes tepidamans]